MCGLFGMAGKGINHQDLKAFRQLGLVTQLRGLDGAGVYIDNVTNKVGMEPVLKKTDFYFSDLASEHKNLMDDAYADVFIGHCRAATIGAVNLENVHPFEKGDWVIAHNGTVFAQEYNIDPDKTDSEQMVEAIAEIGPVEALEKLDYWDAYAITGVNKEKGELLFARNDQRTLFYGIHETRDVLYWASEKEFLELVFNRIDHFGSVDISEMIEEKSITIKVDHIAAGYHELAEIEDIDHSKKWRSRYYGKKLENGESLEDIIVGEREDVPNICVLCKEPLLQSDHVFGVYSSYFQGIVCEGCTYQGRQHA